MNSYLGAVVDWAPFWHAAIVTAICTTAAALMTGITWALGGDPK